MSHTQREQIRHGWRELTGGEEREINCLDPFNCNVPGHIVIRLRGGGYRCGRGGYDSQSGEGYVWEKLEKGNGFIDPYGRRIPGWFVRENHMSPEFQGNMGKEK